VESKSVRTKGLTVREMKLEEVEVVVEYFHRSTAEHLEILGVDPTRLPPPGLWLERYAQEYAQPREKRRVFLVIWTIASQPIGFSTADKIVFGERGPVPCDSIYLFDRLQQSRHIGFNFVVTGTRLCN
jgi:hypothetical protein